MKFHLPPKCDIHAKFELSRLLEGRARECDAAERTYAGQTPGETRANQGTASLVLGLELSNFPIVSYTVFEQLCYIQDILSNIFKKSPQFELK